MLEKYHTRNFQTAFCKRGEGNSAQNLGGIFFARAGGNGMIYPMRRFDDGSEILTTRFTITELRPKFRPRNPQGHPRERGDGAKTPRTPTPHRRSDDDRPSETEHTHSSAIQDPHSKCRPQNSQDTKNLWRAGGAKTPKDSPRHGTRHCADKSPTDETKHTHSVLLHASLA